MSRGTTRPYWRKAPMTLTRHLPVATVGAAFAFLGAIVLGLI
ncbi:hypothetical protein ACRC7T_02755 [Segnochrobactraceae bacterium EtOH-i3]